MRFGKGTIALWFASTAIAVDTVVDLGYSKYRGRIVGDGTTQWLGIRFAAPPLGKLRFASPADPPKTTELQDASRFGPICLPGNPTDWTTRPSTRFTISEDCLYVNVFAPSNATTTSKLPVMFFIQGGGYNSDSNANYNGSDLARNGNMIVVSINYRVGPYGFLFSKEVEEEGGLNTGIQDQIKAFEWTRKNIEKFGGNPEHIVIVGDSAGASSVVIFLTSPKLRDAGLFVGAVSESTYQPRFRTTEQVESQYNCLLTATNCANSTTSLDCLRSVNATKLQTTNCQFAPGLDNKIITTPTIQAFSKGEYAHVPTIFGGCTDEGTKNSPQTTDTLSDFNNFILSGGAPLSNRSLAIIDNIYVTNKTEPVFPNSGRLWRQAANAVGDIRQHCVDKVYQDYLAADGTHTWNYDYGVIDPEQEAKGFGAYHTVELFAVWGPNNTDGNPPKSYNTTNAAIVPVVQNYWISFIKYLDPNKGRLAGAPVWEQWSKEARRIHFVTNGTSMKGMGDLERRCEILDPLVRGLEKVWEEGDKPIELTWKN